MMWLLWCASLLGILTPVAQASQKRYDGDQVLELMPINSAQVDFLKQLSQEEQIDLWRPQLPKDIRPKVKVHTRIPASALGSIKAELKEKYLQYEVLIENIQALLDSQMAVGQNQRTNTAAGNYTRYLPMEEIYQWMDQVKEDYKELVTKHLLGETYQTRPMYYLKISKMSDNPKKIIWLDCGIHAREWITPAFCRWFVKKVLETYMADLKTDHFLENIDLYILPVLNVDGYIHSWTTDRLWRKSMSPCDNSMCLGTDLNRNFDAKWCSVRASTNCCSNVYCGSAPESEPETKAVANFFRNFSPDILCYLSFHSYSQLILTPYAYTYTAASNSEELVSVGKKAANALYQKHGTWFTVGPASHVLYLVAGTSCDWVYDLGINFAYTFELRDDGKYGFLLPENQIQDTCEETMAAVTTIIEHIHDKHFINSTSSVLVLKSSVLNGCLLIMYFVNLQ